MKIPRKITPDHLKDSIVQILFEPLSAPELVLGLFHNAFSQELNFISGNTSRQSKKQIVLETSQQGYFIDSSENIKIIVTDKSITFNSLKDYCGWASFYDLIGTVIKRLLEKKIIYKINRIGVRFISQFDEIAIFWIYR